MMIEYMDNNGTPVSLEELCRREPWRVAGMYRSLEAQVKYFQDTLVHIRKHSPHGPVIVLCPDCPRRESVLETLEGNQDD